MQLLCSLWIDVFPILQRGNRKLHQELSQVSKSSRCYFCLDFPCFPLLLPSLPKLLFPPRRSMVSLSRGGVFPGLDLLCPSWNWCRGLRNDLQEKSLQSPAAPAGNSTLDRGSWAEPGPGDVIPMGLAQHVEVLQAGMV